jgi:hypothetical protein
MIKLPKRVLTLMAAVIVMGGMAQAVTINGIDLPVGATLQIGTLYEGRVSSGYTAPITGAGQELGGVGIVDSIKDASGNIIWQNDQNGTELTFRFGGFISEAPTGGPLPSTPIGINFSGGFVDFFTGTGATNNFTAGSVAAALASATDGVPFLNMVGGSTGVPCPGAGVDCTLQSLILAGSLSSILSGVGNGFLDVTAGPGAANTQFDTNAIPGGHDLALGSSFNSFSATGGFAASGSFDLRGVTVVPEPSTFMLFGLGLLGVVLSTYRHKFNQHQLKRVTLVE